MRRSLLFALLATAGCALPPRDNPNDRSKAPTVAVQLLESGIAVVEVKRSNLLTLRVTAADPQDDPVTVKLTLRDPRTEIVEGSCPRFDPVELETPEPISITSSSASIAWTQFPPPCFDMDGDVQTVEPMPVAIHAEAFDKGGHRGIGSTVVFLANAPPIADAGRSIWVDPSTFDTDAYATVSGLRSRDPDRAFDPADEPAMTYTWTLLAGPPFAGPVALDQPEIQFDIGLGGSLYTLQLVVCDRWECSAPSIVDVHSSPAVWMIASDGLALLDSSWAEARQFYEPAAGTAPQNMPVASEIAPAASSAWVVSQTATAVRMLRGNMVMERAALPANTIVAGGPGFGGPRPSLLGWDARRSVAWFRAYNTSTGLYSLMELRDGSPITATTLTAFTSDEANVTTAIAQFDDTTPLWTMGRDFVNGGFLITKTTTAEGTVRFPSFAGNPDCLDESFNVEFLAAAADGSVWAQSDTGSIHLAPDGEIRDCVTGPRDEFGGASFIANGMLITREGTGEVLSTFANAGTQVITPSGVFDGPHAEVLRAGLGYDRSRDRVVAGTAFSIEAFQNGAYATTVAEVALQQTLAGSFQNLMFALDDGGRPYEISTYYFGDAVTSAAVRLPHSLQLYRTRLRNETLGGIVDDDRLASVDRRTGSVWIARESDGGGYEAAQFDERGAVTDSAGNVITVALPGTPRDLVFDPGDESRAPAIWLSADIAGAPQLFNLALDGTINATFGAGAGPFPTLAARPKRIVLDAFDGTLWATIDGASTPNDGAYHFYRDGSGTFAATTVQTDTGNQIDPSGMLDIDTGNYWFTTNFFSGTQQQQVTRVTPGGTVTPSNITANCGASGTGRAESVHLDRFLDQVVVACLDSSDSLGRIVRVRRSDLVFVAFTTVPPAPADAKPARHISVSPVTGTIWAPGGAEMRFLDRFGNEASRRALPLIVERPIRH